MCQNRSMSGTAKGIMNRTLSEVAARLQTDCDDDPRRIIDKCPNVNFSSDERCPVLSVLEELCASSRFEGRTCEAADDPVRILGKVESQDPEFQKAKNRPRSCPMIWKNSSDNFRAMRKSSRFSKESVTNV